MEDVKITFVGHSTTLIQKGNSAILTDPVFSDNVLFFKRHTKPGIEPKDLPEISAVLISHTHLDHLDMPSFNYIRTSVPIIVPEGSSKVVTKNLPNPVIELSDWSGHDFPDFKIHCVPVVHSSSVACPRRFKRACGYIIEIGGKTIFFAGDSIYDSHFHDIGNTYNIDAALLPISGYKRFFFMKRIHMDPHDAVQAFFDLKAKFLIPIHWGAFKLSLEKSEEPVEWLKRLTAERKIEEQVKILEPGKTFNL